MPGHRLDPPCGRLFLQSPPRLVADIETTSMHLKYLSAAAKDAVAEGGSVPGSRARLWRRIREFNACIPYSGVPSNIEVPEVVLMALITMLPATPNLPPDAPPPPSPSPKAAATVIGFISCLRRLLSSRSAASHVMSFPAAVGRIMGLLRNGSEGVAAEASGLVAFLIGGGPGDTHMMMMDSKGERHATSMHTKSVLFANQSYVTILVNRLKPMSVSPLLSMSAVEVLEAMLCEPHGETTQQNTFVELLRQVAGLRRRLFSLFGHPAASVRETISVIMRTIAEEDAIAAESMRDAALRDGALLRHLLHAFFLPNGERRDLSRQLVAFWADSYQPAFELLSRILPPGLVAYLQTRPDESLTEDSQNQFAQDVPFTRRHRRILHLRRARNAAGSENSVLIPGVEDPDHRNMAIDGAGQLSNSNSVVPENNLSVGPVSGAPTPDASPNLDFNEPRSSLPSDLPAPAQVVIEDTPVGSGRLLCNWHEFWKEFGLDHNRADLIWNERTRQELRESLQAEVHKLDVEKERSEDIVPGYVTMEAFTTVDQAPRISWNYTEFSVSYPSLAKEVCVGQYYLRLLLESGNNFPLRDPVKFFRALYHRFLCDADTGLTVDGAIPDELGASDDWCDMGRLDGFGGGGGPSVRELCARAMTIVYEQHYKAIGPFDGAAHVTVLIDRTDDRALRYRLLLLLKVLTLLPLTVFAFQVQSYQILFSQCILCLLSCCSCILMFSNH